MTQTISRFLFGLLLCSSSCQSIDSSNPLTDEDYKVYSAYLGHFPFYKNVPPTESIVITDSTTINPNDINPKTSWSWILANLGDRCKYLKDTVSCRKAHEPDWASLFENFKQSGHGNGEFLLPSKFKIYYPIQLLSQFRKQLPATNRESNSTAYYIFSLSKVTYNVNKTKALFFGSFICGGTCGRGELIMLEKTDQTWLLIDTFRFWIA